MNCKQVQELLPLYVGRDLEEKRAQTVTAHVQSCAECASSADEYREARQLLQLFAPPPFSEGDYSGIRQRVLREIGRESNASTLPQLLASLFRPRIRWAVASALLLVVSVFAFYFIANRINDQRDGQQLADGGGTIGGPSSLAIKKSAEIPPANTLKTLDPIQGLPGGPHPSQRRKGTIGAPDRIRPATLNTPDARSMTAEASAKGKNLAEPEAVPTCDPATLEKTLRVEIQTKDPNIRIIFFSTQNSQSKSSKGI